mgnify:CR=1 FL=1
MKPRKVGPVVRPGQVWEATDRRWGTRRFVVLALFGQKAAVRNYPGGRRRTIALESFRREKWYRLVSEPEEANDGWTGA